MLHTENQVCKTWNGPGGARLTNTGYMHAAGLEGWWMLLLTYYCIHAIERQTSTKITVNSLFNLSIVMGLDRWWSLGDYSLFNLWCKGYYRILGANLTFQRNFKTNFLDLASPAAMPILNPELSAMHCCSLYDFRFDSCVQFVSVNSDFPFANRCCHA